MISERRRNQTIEYAGVIFGIAGMGLAFLSQGTTGLAPTAPNIALVLASYALSCIGGIALLTTLCGDKNAVSFFAYFESERRVPVPLAKTIAKIIVASSLLALVAVGAQ